MTITLPAQHHGLLLEHRSEGLQLRQLPTPQPGPGIAIVRILEAGVLSYHREVYNGERNYAFPTPLIGGSSAIGRLAAVGPDATALEPGQLVYVDCVVRGRDDQDAIFLLAINEGSSDGSRKLMRDVWRDGVFAEFAKVPLENCVPLNETRLCKDMGYTAQELIYMRYLLVPYGGLRDIRLEAGETIVVCPATGGFGGAGVQVAAAMGARVIAMGRNETELARVKAHVERGTPGTCVETVKISGDEETDLAAIKSFGTIDAVLDMSPPAAAKSTHLRSALRSLRRNGRCSLMGLGELSMSPWAFIGNNLTVKGKLMYERDDMLQFVKMLERGLFPKGADFVDTKSFSMEEWKEAFDVAAVHTGIGRTVSISPTKE